MFDNDLILVLANYEAVPSTLKVVWKYTPWKLTMAHHKSSSNHLPTIIYVVNLLEEMKLSSYLSHNYHQMYPLKTNMKIGKSRRVLIGNTSTHSWWIFQVSDVSELGWCGVSNLLSRRLAVAGFSFHGVNFTSIHPLGFLLNFRKGPNQAPGN